MTSGFDALWQEHQEQIARLRAEVERMRTLLMEVREFLTVGRWKRNYSPDEAIRRTLGDDV